MTYQDKTKEVETGQSQHMKMKRHAMDQTPQGDGLPTTG